MGHRRRRHCRGRPVGWAGIGADALAFLRAGLEVVAVERDPDTAAVAAANLAGRAEVICADAEQVAAELLAPGVSAF